MALTEEVLLEIKAKVDEALAGAAEGRRPGRGDEGEHSLARPRSRGLVPLRSREKGKRGERELARFLSAEGFAATRGAQHRGGPDSPDVRCPDLPALHWECKRAERLNPYDALAQARSEAGERLPVVAFRKNDCDWLAILSLRDLLAILRESSFTGR